MIGQTYPYEVGTIAMFNSTGPPQTVAAWPTISKLFVVHHPLFEDVNISDEWVISHTPTGARILKGFSSMDRAQQFVVEILKRFNIETIQGWYMKTTGGANFTQRDLRLMQCAREAAIRETR